VGNGVDWGMGFVVVAAVAGVVESAVEETLFSFEGRRGLVLLGVVSPIGVIDLFLYESTEVHSGIELIRLCSWI